jgi:prephenate dehydrogenase
MNREAVLEMIDFFADSLAGLRELVASADNDGLERFFAQSKERRDAIV